MRWSKMKMKKKGTPAGEESAELNSWSTCVRINSFRNVSFNGRCV